MSASSLTLKDSVVLVTGASGGIGGAICEAMREAGARVVATDLQNAPPCPAADVSLVHDVTSPDDWRHVVEETRSRFGRLDCLINNAGISFVESIADTSLEQWRRVMRVNVESVLLGLQAGLPLLRESGAHRPGGAAVVNISSTASFHGSELNGAYGASKAAVTLLSKSAAKEFGRLGYPVRVNTVHPGVVETGMTESVLKRCVETHVAANAEERRALWSTMSPLGRLAKPQEIAGGVVFLCSPAASYITGSELVIDGGVTA